MTSPTTRLQVQIALVPRDGFFFKDGRGWHTSASGRGHGLAWPWPSTILGALRSAWGRVEEARSDRAFRRCDWIDRTRDLAIEQTVALCRSHGSDWSRACRVWPVPADAAWFDGERAVVRLEPVPPALPTLGANDDEVREDLWRPRLEQRGRPSLPPHWWPDALFAEWLAGRSVSAGRSEDRLLLTRRTQTRLGIDPQRFTAEDGVLFSHDVVETLQPGAEWAIGARLALPCGALPHIATLGSDRRIAIIEELPEDMFAPPESLREAFAERSTGGLRMVIVTPTCFERGWLPDGFQEQSGEYRGWLPGVEGELVLRAAYVPRPLHVSGWDMSRGRPKPTNRMVAPGAVYFFQSSARENLVVDLDLLWLARLGTHTTEGFGRAVPGLWTPRRRLR